MPIVIQKNKYNYKSLKYYKNLNINHLQTNLKPRRIHWVYTKMHRVIDKDFIEKNKGYLAEKLIREKDELLIKKGKAI
jgi:hypothetical protein